MDKQTRITGKRRQPTYVRRRAVAMLIVLLAVAALVPVTYVFVVNQSTTIRMAKNIENRAKSRGVAEAGLRLAIAYVQREASWRNDQTHGVWVTDVPYADGVFTITGEDGCDLDGDGILTNLDATDGDLADDPNDKFTLTVTGKVDGAAYVARAVVTPVSGSCGPGIVVSESIDVAGEQPGSRILPFGQSASIATNSTASGRIDIGDKGAVTADVWVGPGRDPDSEPGGVIVIRDDGQLTGAVRALEAPIEIPAVAAPTNVGYDRGNTTLSYGTTTWNDNRRYTDLIVENWATLRIEGDVTLYCDDDLTFRGNSQLIITEGSSLTLFVQGQCRFRDDARVNVGSADPGKLTIKSLATGDQAIIVVQDDAIVYANIEAPNCELTVNDDGFLYGTFVGRSVDTRDNGQIHVDCREPTTVEARANLLSLTSQLNFGGWNSYIDSYDSSLGPYGQVNQSSDALVTVNATGSDRIVLYSSTSIRGDALIGPGGNVSAGIREWGGSVVTGEKGTLNAVVEMPTLSAPTGSPFAGPSSGNIEMWGNMTSAISTNRRLGSIRLWGASRLTVEGDVTVLLDGSLEVDTNARFDIRPDSSLNLYVKGTIVLAGKINANTANPSKLKIYMLKGAAVEMWGSSELHSVVQNPNGDLNVWGSAQFFGTYMGRRLQGGGQIHLDRHAAGGAGGNNGGGNGGGLGGGNAGGLGTDYTYTTQWLAVP
jgi:hypothetical protein